MQQRREKTDAKRRCAAGANHDERARRHQKHEYSRRPIIARPPKTPQCLKRIAAFSRLLSMRTFRESKTIFGAAAPSEKAPRVWRFALALTVAAALVFTLLNLRAPLVAGDAGEYLTMAQSWTQHATPDARAEDFAAVDRVARENGFLNPKPKIGFFSSPRDGRFYCWHFWLYPLFAAPLMLALRAIGGNEFTAFSLLNALLFCVALAAIFRLGTPEKLPHRIALFTLCAATPILWYLRWPTPEVFTWCGVLLCLLLLEEKRFASAALFASLAALQNPPVLFLALLVLGAAFFASRVLPKTQRLRVLAPVAAATLLALLPNFFYLVFFGQSSLILSRAYGGVDAALISPVRVASFLFDLNQGATAYLPLLFILVGVAFLRAVKSRDALALGVFAALLAMILACCLNAHWNVGEAGMRRYLAWMTPIFVWLALRGTREYSRVWMLALAAVFSQLAIVSTHDGAQFFKSHTPWAALVLKRAPQLYNPDFLIFIERSPKRTLLLRRALPVAFLNESGDATKLLCDAQSLPQVNREFVVTKDFLAQLRHRAVAENGKPFYANPPRGAVCATPQTLRKYRDYQALYGNW